jgi:glycosyltransferase involved in cell wall biosynthesis
VKLLVVSVFLNEEDHLPGFLESVLAQTRPPDRLVLVDDGSADRSPAIAEAFAREHAWVDVVRHPTRSPERDRLVSQSVWMSFSAAVDGLGPDAGYDIVAKVDTDLRLTAQVFAEVEARFLAEATLGVTGPYLVEADGAGRTKRLRWRPEHVGGAVKFYRRACYDDVYPLPPILNLDMMDEVKARSRGWTTASFDSAGGDPLHRRRHGARDGVLRGYRRWGRGDYVSGGHPLLVAYVGLQRLPKYPPVLGSLNYFGGWAMAAIRRAPRFPPELRARHRQEQLAHARRRVHRVLGRGRSLGGRSSAGSPERAGR